MTAAPSFGTTALCVFHRRFHFSHVGRNSSSQLWIQSNFTQVTCCHWTSHSFCKFEALFEIPDNQKSGLCTVHEERKVLLFAKVKNCWYKRLVARRRAVWRQSLHPVHFHYRWSRSLLRNVPSKPKQPYTLLPQRGLSWEQLQWKQTFHLMAGPQSFCHGAQWFIADVFFHIGEQNTCFLLFIASIEEESSNPMKHSF